MSPVDCAALFCGNRFDCDVVLSGGCFLKALRRATARNRNRVMLLEQKAVEEKECSGIPSKTGKQKEVEEKDE